MFTFIDLSCRYVLWALSFNPSRFWQTNYLFAYSFWQIYLSFVKFNKVFEISLSILHKFSKRKHRVVKLSISFWIDWFLHAKQMGKLSIWFLQCVYSPNGCSSFKTDTAQHLSLLIVLDPSYAFARQFEILKSFLCSKIKCYFQ